MAIDPWGTSGGYMSADDFRSAMDATFGKGKWRETGGWRSQAREEQLRNQGALTVKPGAISAHSVGSQDAPGAHDIVVDGLTPQQAAAKLRAAGLPTSQVLPEGQQGSQGPHLHVGLAPGDDPWAAPGSDPWSSPAPPAPASHGFWDEAGRLTRSFIGGAAQGAAKIVKGAGELGDLYVQSQAAQGAATGAISGPGGEAVLVPDSARPELAKVATDHVKTVSPRTAPVAAKVDAWGSDLGPADRNLPESVLHGVGEMAAPITGAMVNPALGAAAFGAQGYEGTHAEALAHGANEDTAQAAGMESGAIQAGLGSLPVGEAVAPIVRGVKGAIPTFFAKAGAQAAGDAAVGGSMQVGENVVAEQNYDSSRPWYANVPEAASTMALGGAALHTVAGVGGAAVAGVKRLRPAEQPVEAAADAAAPAVEADAEPAAPPMDMPEATAAHAYAQSTAHIRGAVTPDQVAVEPVEPPLEYEQARVAEGAPPEEMAPAIADVAEYRGAAPRGYSLFQAMKDLGGVRTKDAAGAVDGDAADILKDIGRPGLVNNKSGLSPDAMREALQERGWFGEFQGEGARAGDDVDHLYGLMREEARGEKVYHPTDVSPETVLRRGQLEQDFAEAGVEPHDDTAVAAAKVAAYRSAKSKESGIPMELLRARADEAGVPHDTASTYDDLLGDVVEREAIRDEYDGAAADADERILDEHLTPEEHHWLTHAGRGAEGERDAAGQPEGAGEQPASGAGPPDGDREPDPSAEGDPWGSSALPEPYQLGPSERQNIGGETVEQNLFPGTEQSALQAAAARDGALKPKTAQAAPDGLFAAREPEQASILDHVDVKPLTDAGEKIGGARKDQWAERGLRTSDLEGVSEGEAHQLVVKDHVWPKPDYAAEVAAGVDPVAAALKKLIRDRLAAKPRTDSAQGRRDYIEMMGMVRDVFDAAKTVAEVRAARATIIHDKLGWARDTYTRPDKAISDRLFSIFKGRSEKLGVSGADMRKAKQLVDEGFPEKAAPWSRRFDLRAGSDGKFAVYPKGKYRAEAIGFEDREAAAAKAKELYETQQSAGGEEAALPERPHLDKLERSGPDVRGGKSVSGDDFVSDFGFRGVEFGNWVASDERQKAVNLAYDALHDMANVLGIPPEAVSLDGKLGLAFGARGNGRAAAHYEPGKLVINLTKLSGAGSLGHEWGHALDHYFGTLDRDDGTAGAARGASGWYDRVRDVRSHLSNLRPEMAEAFHNVMDAIFHRDLPRAEAVRQAELRVEEIQAAIDRQQERLKKHLGAEGGVTDKKFVAGSKEYIAHQERVLAAQGELLAKLRDEAAPYTGAKVKSSYLTEAAKLSGKTGEAGYWARPTELFARAFESYLFDRIKAEDRRSDYLVQGVEPERYASEIFKGNPYPTGLEREAIDHAFGQLFDTMSVRDGEKGPALFRRGQGFGEGAKMLARGLEGVEPDRISQKAHAEIIKDVHDVLQKIAPHAESRPMAAMREPGSGARIEAAAWREGLGHVVAWSLDTPDAVGAARHEAVHALRGAGLFKEKEWSALAAAAAEEGWLNRYHIAERYPDLNADGQIEEAVAERFADWRRDKQPPLPAFARELFRRIDTALRQVAAVLRKGFGRDATASDILLAMDQGQVGDRVRDRAPQPRSELAPAFQRPREEPAEASKARDFINRSLGDGVDALGHRLKRAVERVMPDPMKEALDSLQLGVSPMAQGSTRAKATAKDFANTLRETAWEWGRVDGWLEKTFTHEQRARMWTAADEESVIRQRGGEPGPTEGLNRLPPAERAAVDELQRRADQAFARAKTLGMTKADPLPSYVPRMVVEMTGDGAQRVKGGEGPTSGKAGRNLSTTTGQLRHREYETVEQTEAAARAKFGEGATVVRDIRTLGLATGKLEQAIAGRTLINKIREIGDQIGQATVTDGATPDTHDFFTIDHPAMKVWGPKFAIDAETGKAAPITGPDGKPVMEARPLYVSKEFEGPLKAVLSTPTGPIYNAILGLKGKAMSIIMFSPLMHNAVIWGKAIPAAPREVLSFQIYSRGYQAKNDPALMREALQAGLDPIGKNYAQTQDITAVAAPKQIAPGQSWTAQIVSSVPGLFSKEAGEATKRAIDKIGDVWHNTFLWDRVADLQMGLYKTIRDGEIKKGLDPESAQRLAAHFANRYAGVLPIEGMSKVARQIANVMLFSRSFTLGNLGAYKDIVRGLPGEVQAQILRDSGAESLGHVQGEARRKAISMLALDVALSYAGVWLAAGAVSAIAHRPFQAPSDNEPNKEDRFLIRYQPDGTAVYGRLPTGKVGEDLVHWATEPMETLKAKLSPFGRLIYEMAANDKGFGQKLYNPYDKTPLGLVRNIGRVTWAAMSSIAPTGVFQGAHDMVTGTGKGDRTTAAMQTVLPMAGITVSTGAPGGPAMGDLYAAQDRHQFDVQETLPAIMQQAKGGDVSGARARMAELGIAPGLQSYYIRVARNPSLRLTPRKIQEFNRTATMTERAKFTRDRAAAADRNTDQ